MATPHIVVLKMKLISILREKPLFLIALISLSVFVLTLIWHNLDRSFFLGLLFNDAKEFAEKGMITSNFMPIGYSGFLAFCMKVGGEAVIPICQSFIYAGILFLAYWFYKTRKVTGILLVLGILALAFHPIIFLNIWRIHDGNLTILLLLGFLTAAISYSRFKKTWKLFTLGIFSGILFVVRQNTAPLFLIVLFFLWDRKEAKTKFLKNALLFLVITFISTASVNLILKKKIIYLGDQGYYNLFSGTNEYASRYLLKDFSGENSLEPALKARGFTNVGAFEERLVFPSEAYKKLSLEYIIEHPLDYAKLTILKAYTLFRPGYHSVESPAFSEVLKQSLKIILSLPFFIWLFLVIKTKRSFLKKENLFVFLCIVFYILPFLFANADPRYRFPIDIIFIVDSFYLVSILKERNV